MSFQSRDLAIHLPDQTPLWLGCPNTGCGGGSGAPPPEPCEGNSGKPPCPNSGCPQNTNKPYPIAMGDIEDLRRQLRQTLSQ